MNSGLNLVFLFCSVQGWFCASNANKVVFVVFTSPKTDCLDRGDDGEDDDDDDDDDVADVADDADDHAVDAPDCDDTNKCVGVVACSCRG